MDNKGLSLENEGEGSWGGVDLRQKSYWKRKQFGEPNGLWEEAKTGRVFCRDAEPLDWDN
jgi:hypothetical protein